MVKTRMIVLMLLICGVLLANDVRADEEALFITKTDAGRPDSPGSFGKHGLEPGGG